MLDKWKKWSSLIKILKINSTLKNREINLIIYTPDQIRTLKEKIKYEKNLLKFSLDNKLIIKFSIKKEAEEKIMNSNVTFYL